MNEITPYQPAQQPATQDQTHRAPAELDEWVHVVRDVSRLASQIADTPFVPDSMRGNPAAVTAAILSGREMGLGPMTSLQHIHVIRGRPAKSAEIMRAMVLGHGHHIRDVEITDTRAVLEGRRADEETWTRVTFTADQAKKAKIDLGGYPEDKLYARATTRLCRRKFADVVGGISATVDELEDDPADQAATPTPAAAPTAGKRTAKRRTPSKASGTQATSDTGSTGAQEATVAAGPPPLPGDSTPPSSPPQDDTPAPDSGQPAEPAEPPPAGNEQVSRAQLDKIHAQLTDLAITDRHDKLATVAGLVGRLLTTSNELTGHEASQVIDMLARVLDSDDPQRALDAVLAAVENQDTQDTRDESDEGESQ